MESILVEMSTGQLNIQARASSFKRKTPGDQWAPLSSLTFTLPLAIPRRGSQGSSPNITLPLPKPHIPGSSTRDSLDLSHGDISVIQDGLFCLKKSTLKL